MIGIFFKSLFILFLSIGGLIGLGLAIIKTIEYIEDKAYAAKKRIKSIIQISMILHLFFIIRCRAILQCLFSLSVQYSFLCLLDVYPIIKLDNPLFIYGTLASLLNHFFIIRLLFYTRIYTVEVIFFFLLIWVTPFCFFISLSANDEVIIVKGKSTCNTLIGNLLKNLMNKDSKNED